MIFIGREVDKMKIIDYIIQGSELKRLLKESFKSKPKGRDTMSYQIYRSINGSENLVENVADESEAKSRVSSLQEDRTRSEAYRLWDEDQQEGNVEYSAEEYWLEAEQDRSCVYYYREANTVNQRIAAKIQGQ